MFVPDYALRLLRAFQDPSIFVAVSGEIHAANAPAREALGIADERPTACNLKTLVAHPAALQQTLRGWSRSSDLLPGSFAVASAASVMTFSAKGAVIFGCSEHTPTILLVRFSPRERANPFVLLNQKIAQLNDEVARRIQVEDALRRSEAALRERADEAEMLNRAKDEFLATVSHELRTPLNAILGWASILRTGPQDAHLTKGLEVIHRNAESQAKIIDDILDVSRVITGKLLLETGPVNLVAVVEEAIEVVRTSAAAKQITIELVRACQACVLVADANRLRQAVWNLLSNALKFTDRGGHIRVEVAQVGSSASLVIGDTGHGIDPEFLPYVFDRFKQADSSMTRRTGGLGLGLSLVRHIVELHGGSVEAKSDGLGSGSTFTIMLPIRAVAPATARQLPKLARPAGAASPDLTVHGLRILVVDDEPDARELLTAVLSRRGAQVEVAGCVADALEALPHFRPNLLVSDIGLPGEDGYSFIRKIRQLRKGHGIPALALTAYTRAQDRELALSAGFDAHVGKPVNPDELVEAIAGLAAKVKRSEGE